MEEYVFDGFECDEEDDSDERRGKPPECFHGETFLICSDLEREGKT